MSETPGYSEAFIPGNTGSDSCSDDQVWGDPSTVYSYILKPRMKPEDEWDAQCDPLYHKTAKIDSLRINTDIQGPGGSGAFAVTSSTVAFSGAVTATTVTCGGAKCFNIPHPTKENKRLVHACIEGPETAVYVRGRLTDNSVIELPDYWKGLVDPDSITVSLTQIGSSQDLIVEGVDWGNKVRVRSGNASRIDCYYNVTATRIDLAPLEVEQDA
tara:strand:- start:24456 stop:25097 length:642 start_codon:yes stop_codon:yes gene_type:complete